MYISKTHTAVIVNNEPDAKQKRSIAWIIAMQNDKAIKEQQYAKNNTCPNCHFVLPTSGICDCGYIKK